MPVTSGTPGSQDSRPAAGPPSTITVLCTIDLTAWRDEHTAHQGPGGALPYGLTHLVGHDVTLRWSSAHHHGPWDSRALHRAAGAVRRLAPGWQGTLGAAHNRHVIASSDAVVSVFENAGLGLARLQRLGAVSRRTPHLMITCWLAEEVGSASPREVRSIRRSLGPSTTLAVFSANQVPMLAAALDVPEHRIVRVPFGVDTSYYDPAHVSRVGGGAGIVAVGSDSNRDYATLFEAVRLAGVPVTVVCQPRNLVGLDVPPHVTVLTGVYDAAYRSLLHDADLVVTPTTAPAYPSGQSVVLEAMAMGRPTLTTDSPAMREYVPEDVGALVPARDPELLAAAMASLAGDPQRRSAMSRAARPHVVDSFTLDSMWTAVRDVLATLR